MFKLLENKEIKVLIGNFISMGTLKVLNLILPLVTMPYLIKILGLASYGAIFMAISLLVFFQSIVDYGFDISATRDLAKCSDDHLEIERIYSTILMSKFYLLIISIFLYLIIIFFFLSKSTYLIFLIMIPSLVGYCFFPVWFFKAIQKMKYITILDFLVKLFITIGVFVFIKESKDFWIYPVLQSLSYIVISIISLWVVYKWFGLAPKYVKFALIRQQLVNNFPLFVNQFIPNLYNSLTNFLVGILLGHAAAGFFGAVRQIASIPYIFNSVVSIVMFPYLNKNRNKFQVFSKVYVSFMVLILLIFYFLGYVIFPYLNIVQNEVNMLYGILLVGVFFIVLNSMYATNFLLTYGYDKKVMKYTLIASIWGGIVSVPLLKMFGVLGAGITIMSSQLIIGILPYLYYRKLNFVGNMRR